MDKNTIDALTFTAGMLLIVFIAAVAFSVVIGIGMYLSKHGKQSDPIGHRARCPQEKSFPSERPSGLIWRFLIRAIIS